MRKLVFPFLAVLVAVLAWVLLPEDRVRPDRAPERVGGGPTPSTEGAISAPDLGAESERSRSQVREAVASSAAFADEPEAYRRGLGGLRGRLVWEGSKEPVPGVEVQAIEAWLDTLAPSLEDVLGLAGDKEPWLFRGKDTTDAEGRFAIPGVHGRAILLLAIGLRSDKAALRFVDRSPPRGGTVDLGDIVLLRRGVVTGRVVGNEGQPIGGARVRVVDVPSMMLQFGVSQFDAEGLVAVGIGSRDVDQVLPMPKWVAKLDQKLPFAESTSERDGRFEVRGARPGQSTVLVQHPGHVPATRSLRVRSEKTSSVGELELRAGERISGSVKDSAGNPITTARVTAGPRLNMAPIAFLRKPIDVSADGSFRLEGLERGKLVLAFQRDRGEPWMVHGTQHGGDVVEIVLPSLGAGTVEVVDAKNEPIPQVRLTIMAADEVAFFPGLERRLDPGRHLTQVADRPGTWKVYDLPQGRYRIVGSADGFAIGVALLEIGEDPSKAKAKLTLVAAHRQRFEAVDAKGMPVAGARVYWNASSGRGPGAQQVNGRMGRLHEMPILLGRTDEAGVFESDKVEVGAHRFFARHPAFALAHSGEQRSARDAAIRFVLRAGGAIHGTVTERGAQPAEVQLVMAEPGWQTARNFEGALLPRFAATTPDGGFRFEHLDAGPWKVRIAPPFGKMASIQDFTKLIQDMWQWPPAQSVEVVEGGVARVSLELVPATDQSLGSGSLVGSLRLTGDPAEGARVAVWTPKGRRRTLTDAAGTFAIEGLPDGRLSVRIQMLGEGGVIPDELWSGDVDIKNGSQAALHLDLRVTTVRVKVVDPDGNPLRGLLVGLAGVVQAGTSKGGVQLRAMTDGEGIASFDRVPEGGYNVTIEGGRDVKWVLPTKSIEAWVARSGVLHEVRAIPSATISGTVALDVDALDAVDRQLALKERPQWLSLTPQSGRNAWGQIRYQGDTGTFIVEGLAPGSYKVQCWGQLSWVGDPVEVPPAGLSELELVLRPDPKSLEVRRKAQKR